MKRRFAIGTLLALVLVLGITVTVMAAAPEPNGAAGLASQGAALNDTFFDGNNDGVCDNYGERLPVQDGTGKQLNGRQHQQSGQGTHPQDGTGQHLYGRLNNQ